MILYNGTGYIHTHARTHPEVCLLPSRFNCFESVVCIILPPTDKLNMHAMGRRNETLRTHIYALIDSVGFVDAQTHMCRMC